MPAASFTQHSFLGGEWSKTVQGRMDRPDYRTAMQVCRNAMPFEQGAWTRRPGTMHLGHTRGGVPGRVIAFDFKQAAPYTMEFTAGFLRFRAGTNLVATNDQRLISAVSAANPAEITTLINHTFATGNQVYFFAFDTVMPLLQNRQFSITVTAANKFTIVDAITGLAIDGATLGTFTAGNPAVARVLEFATPYTGTMWQTLRSIQADIPIVGGTTQPGAFLLHGAIKPYVLQVASLPNPAISVAFATFTFAAANFKDGPYLDPVAGGTLATPSALIGIITLALSFPAYDAARAYAIGDYVSSAGVNYKSLVDANLASAPPSANWVAVSAGDAIGPNGFTGADVGRMVRLYSEPALWAVATAYAKDAVVAYGGTGTRSDGAVYWISLTAGNTGNIPGADLTKWAIYPNGARWTWGKITALTNIIDRGLAGSVNIGDMNTGGGLAAAFDGNLNQLAAASAEKNISGGVTPPFQPLNLSSYVGKNYTAATDQKITQAIVYPSSDNGLAFGSYAAITHGVLIIPLVTTIVLNLRGKASAPADASDGTLLATSTPIANTTAPITLISTDQVTAWKFVWVEQITTSQIGGGAGASSFTLTNAIAELSLINPAGTGSAAGVSLQILGDALLYTTAIRTWRVGLYSDNTGWPTCGTYHEGRLWLSGVVANRIDSSRSNEPFNFAPTNADGSVPGNAGISYTFNAPDVNPIFWMEPDDNGIVCGTQSGEWLVRATQTNIPLTPTTTQAHRVTKYNCANVLPAKTNLTTVIVQAFRRELLEYFPDVYSGKFSAADLAFTAKHLVETGMAEVGYQQELIPIIWARMADGTLAGCTYGRRTLVSSNPPDYAGWHRHDLGSGRSVESITIGGSRDGTLDALFMVTTNDSNIRHVEMLTNVFVETDALGDAWFLDNAVTPTSSTNFSATIVGNDGFTKILLHMDGADTSAGFIDSNTGGSAHTWTAVGNAQIDTAQSKFGGASGLFDGTADCITTPAHADFALGSTDFTIDCWFNCTAASGIFSQIAGQIDAAGTNASQSFKMERSSGDKMVCAVAQGGSEFAIAGTTTITNVTNTGWHHLAFVRTGNVLKMFVDGIQEGGDLGFTGAVNNSGNLFGVGRRGEQLGFTWFGWIDEFRLSVGIARWIVNFTPPISPYGVTPYGGRRFNGLWHLNGEMVSVFAAGLDCAMGERGVLGSDFLVTNGSIDVPYGDGVAAGSGGGLFTQTFAEAAVAAGQVVVGFTYDSDGQITRPNLPPESGARNGPAFGKLRRQQQYAFMVDQTAGLNVGTRFDKLDLVKFNPQGSGVAMGPGQTFSGIYRADLQDDNTFNGAMCWRVSRPLPATIATVAEFLHTQDI